MHVLHNPFTCPVACSQQRLAVSNTCHRRIHSRHFVRRSCSSKDETATQGSSEDASTSNAAQKAPSRNKEISKAARNVATTFAPRASTASKNPAYPGSLLYTIFEVQAWASLVVGGLLSFNIIFPSEQPTIARLMGMWSAWMFTVPSLRARDCSAAEKDGLNILFILIPLLNVGLPFVWKSFPFIFSADVVAVAAVYSWKLGLPFQSSKQ